MISGEFKEARAEKPIALLMNNKRRHSWDLEPKAGHLNPNIWLELKFDFVGSGFSHSLPVQNGKT